MNRELVFVGGGHAHLTALLHLEDMRRAGAQVTLISPDAYHYYSGMGPGMLSGRYRPQEVRFHVKKMVEARGAAFIEDSVTRIDPDAKSLLLRSGNRVRYDFVSFNTGSTIPFPGAAQELDNTFTVKPIINLLKARAYILQRIARKHLHVCIVGGGPAGVELAGNVWRIAENEGKRIRITLLAGERLLRHLPCKVRSYAYQSLAGRDISIMEGRRVKEVSAGTIVLEDSSVVPYDLVLLATGVIPPSMFRISGIPVGADGGLLVNSFLQSVRYPEIFGGGDCINLDDFRLPRVGVYAVRENPVLYHNLLASLKGSELRTFVPQKQYLLIFNMGDDRGIFWRGSLVWEGRLAFRLKDYIDRKFMRKFQVSGELSDPV
ncbi:MAG TPA: FAD-dependent oxidoreductase [Thermodesulfovibrionales bacterium]|nr:FAD-dependent oxidoreductase [Thermodesulfovibrionales bacterium]